MKDFIEEARALVASTRCKTMREAMKKVRREQPNLHKKFLQRQAETKVTLEKGERGSGRV